MTPYHTMTKSAPDCQATASQAKRPHVAKYIFPLLGLPLEVLEHIVQYAIIPATVPWKGKIHLPVHPKTIFSVSDSCVLLRRVVLELIRARTDPWNGRHVIFRHGTSDWSIVVLALVRGILNRPQRWWHWPVKVKWYNEKGWAKWAAVKFDEGDGSVGELARSNTRRIGERTASMPELVDIR